MRVHIRRDSSETGVFLLDEDGATRVGAAQIAHGGCGFALHGPDMKGAAVLHFRGHGRLTFYDSSGAVGAGGGSQNLPHPE